MAIGTHFKVVLALFFGFCHLLQHNHPAGYDAIFKSWHPL